MRNIDAIESGGAGSRPFSIIYEGYRIPLRDPREMNFQEVLLALYIEHAPWTPGDIPEWKRSRVFEHWRAAWDLPRFEAGRRLAYVVDNYYGAVLYDLAQINLDPGELWRARRWRTMLEIIDRLPPHSHYSVAVSNDQEHVELLAKQVAENRAKGGPQKDDGPSMLGWTPEVAALNGVIDAVNRVTHAVVAVQSPKGKAPDPPKAMPRPQSALERAIKAAEHERRKAKHDALVARMLPHRE